jgi:spermidine synthase
MNQIEYLSSTERSIGLFYLSRYPEEGHPGGWVYEVHIDGALLMSSVSPLSERLLAIRAAAAHKGDKPLRILIGGLGLGYTAQAALEGDKVDIVRVIDRMDFVMGWLKEGLLPLSKALCEDERVEFVQGDVYGDLMGPATEKWDLILVDVDHSPVMPLDPASLPFYTPEGQARVREHLAPGGILAVWSAHNNDEFADVLSEVYSEAWREHIEWSVPFDGGADDLHNVLFLAR